MTIDVGLTVAVVCLFVMLPITAVTAVTAVVRLVIFSNSYDDEMLPTGAQFGFAMLTFVLNLVSLLSLTTK